MHADASTPAWSYERLLQLAPDAGTLEQARRLFFAKRWKTLAGNGEHLWGEYETRYGHQYQAVVRLAPPLFRCNCNSKRRPCKHALALVLLFLNRNEVWTVRAQLPDWAVKLQGVAVTERKASTINAAGQEKRIRLMDQGVVELSKWLRQLARLGLAHFLNAPEEWETLAVRMTDAKLSGMAGRIRRCITLLAAEAELDAIVDEVAYLYLFVRAWERKSTLADNQKRELLQVAGWNVRKEQVLSAPAVDDNWLVLGVVSGTEDKLQFRRTWLRGEKTGKYALLLDYAWGHRGFEDQWVTGSVLAGALAYYPGQPPLRAVFKQYRSSRAPYEAQAAYAQFAEMQAQYAAALGASLWLYRFPVLIDEVVPVYQETEALFVLVDPQKNYLQLSNQAKNWKLLALSGGHPISCFGEYDGRKFYPISVFSEGRVVLL